MKRAIGNEISAWASDEGVFIGPGIALVRRLGTHGAGRYQPRLLGDLNAQLSKSWGHEVALTRATYETLTGAGIALDRGDLVFAGRLAELVRLPLPAPGSPAALAKYRPDQAREANGRFANEGRGGAQTAQGSTPRRGSGATPPAYRSQAVPQRVWEGFVTAAEKVEPSSPTKQYIYSEIFAAEGGLRYDPEGPASSGITPDSLKAAQAKGIPELQGVTDIRALTIEQRILVYRSYLDDALSKINGKSNALSEIADQHSAAALVDPIVRYGDGTGGALVRRGINDAIARLSPEERAGLGLSPIPPSGKLDQQAFDAFKTLDREGHGAAVRGTIADRRIERIENQTLDDRKKGEIERANHFR